MTPAGCLLTLVVALSFPAPAVGVGRRKTDDVLQEMLPEMMNASMETDPDMTNFTQDTDSEVGTVTQEVNLYVTNFTQDTDPHEQNMTREVMPEVLQSREAAAREILAEVMNAATEIDVEVTDVTQDTDSQEGAMAQEVNLDVKNFTQDTDPRDQNMTQEVAPEVLRSRDAAAGELNVTQDMAPEVLQGREAAAEEFLKWMSAHDAPRGEEEFQAEDVGNLVMDAARETRARYQNKFLTAADASLDTGANITAVVNPANLVPTAGSICQDDQLKRWENRKGMQRIFKVWNDYFDNSFAFSHHQMAEAGSVCVVKGAVSNPSQGLNLNIPLTPPHGSKVLNLVWDSRQPICNTEQDRFQYYQPEIFYVHGPMASRGSERNVGWVWPKDGTCTWSNTCPIVFFFSGIGEHSQAMSNNNKDLFKKGFENIHKWGLLRYAERDRNCLQDLHSVVVVPELDRHETWVTHGEELTNYFIMPLLRRLRETKGNILDFNRVSLIGYSEGAFGALQAALLRPDVFTAAVAASASTSQAWWNRIPVPKQKKPLGGSSKLQTVILAMGEYDTSGVDEPENLGNALRWLDRYGVLDRDVTLMGVFYASLSHQEVWEHVYNRWGAFHQSFWQGRYRRYYA